MDQSEQQTQGARSLWFGILAAPIAWFLHLSFGWALAEMGCPLGVTRILTIGSTPVYLINLLVIGATGIAMGASAFGGLTAYRFYSNSGANERVRFMGMFGMLFTALFVLAIILSTLPAFILPPCTAGMDVGV
jgi:hypothetical protein